LFHCLFTAGCKVEEHRVVGEPGQHEHTHQQEASVSHQLRAVQETGTGEGGEGELVGRVGLCGDVYCIKNSSGHIKEYSCTKKSTFSQKCWLSDLHFCSK